MVFGPFHRPVLGCFVVFEGLHVVEQGGGHRHAGGRRVSLRGPAEGPGRVGNRRGAADYLRLGQPGGPGDEQKNRPVGRFFISSKMQNQNDDRLSLRVAFCLRLHGGVRRVFLESGGQILRRAE